MKYIKERDMIVEAAKVSSSMLKDFERQYTNDFNTIWDDGDFGMEEGELTRDDVEDKVKEIITDRNLSIDSGMWSNTYLDGIIDGITTTQNGQLPGGILATISNAFKDVVQSIFIYILDRIEEGDEDFVGKYDVEYVNLIVSDYLMESNDGIMYTGDYAELISSILMDPKFHKAELKKFVLKMIKAGKIHVISIMKDIDKAMYKKYEKLFDLNNQFDFFGENTNETVKVVSKGKDVIVYKVKGVEDLESLIEDPITEMESFRRVYVFDFIKENNKVMSITTEDLYIDANPEDLDFYHYSFIKKGDRHDIVLYYDKDGYSLNPMSDNDINSLIKKYKLESTINKLYNGYIKETLTAKDIKNIKLEYLLYVYSAKKELFISGIDGPNREGEDSLMFYGDGPLYNEINTHVDNNITVMNFIAIKEEEDYSNISELNKFVEILSSYKYAYTFKDNNMWFALSKYKVPAHKYEMNDSFGESHSRKGIHGYESKLGDEIEVPVIEIFLKVMEDADIKDFQVDSKKIKNIKYLVDLIVTAIKAGNFKYANLLKEIDIDAYEKYKYLLDADDFGFFSDDDD